MRLSCTLRSGTSSHCSQRARGRSGATRRAPSRRRRPRPRRSAWSWSRRGASARDTGRPCRAAALASANFAPASAVSCGQHHRFAQSRSLKSNSCGACFANRARTVWPTSRAGSPLPDTRSANGKRAISCAARADQEHAEHVIDARFDVRLLPPPCRRAWSPPRRIAVQDGFGLWPVFFLGRFRHRVVVGERDRDNWWPPPAPRAGASALRLTARLRATWPPWRL